MRVPPNYGEAIVGYALILAIICVASAPWWAR